ncbi:hypothetical protein L596_006570 [Steinernema carpocapsae]|uniref:Uncharacterized protein n=1 Tax=Steinernema carpocapsae TaxID=34508 RepID=A0A4U8V2Q2_STECR|nr:hypothetical protein L596_006570 [Steinernema carpocapsae]
MQLTALFKASVVNVVLINLAVCICGLGCRAERFSQGSLVHSEVDSSDGGIRSQIVHAGLQSPQRHK